MTTHPKPATAGMALTEIRTTADATRALALLAAAGATDVSVLARPFEASGGDPCIHVAFHVPPGSTYERIRARFYELRDGAIGSDTSVLSAYAQL